MKASRHVTGRLDSLGAVVRRTGCPVWAAGITWFWPTAVGGLHGWAYLRQVLLGQLLAQLVGSSPTTGIVTLPWVSATFPQAACSATHWRNPYSMLARLFGAFTGLPPCRITRWEPAGVGNVHTFPPITRTTRKSCKLCAGDPGSLPGVWGCPPDTFFPFSSRRRGTRG